MIRQSGRSARRDAPALRFLLLCGGGWIALRVLVAWNPAVSAPPMPPSPWAPAPRFATNAISPPPAAADRAGVDGGAETSPVLRLPPIPEGRSGWRGRAATPRGTEGGLDRHSLRVALMARLLSPLTQGDARAAVPVGAIWMPSKAAARAEPGSGAPFWMVRDLSGWSVSGWLFLRQGSASAPGPIAAGGELGGSQAGMRIAYGFGDQGRARAFARATIATDRPDQREVALGLAFAPVARLPVDIAIEQRLAVGREGRTALAATVGGGVSDVALPGGFRLEAYGQAGVVGVHRRDGFAEAAVVVDHAVGPDAPLRLGTLAAAAAQPGASRVDVGPRLTLRLPDVGRGGRIAVDWRQRVAGEARPASGLAVTLAADF